MTAAEIISYRSLHQRLLASSLKTPREVVPWMVAMQAQEFAHAKWAIALRLNQATCDNEIEVAFNAGEILRTHVMRPTWHFVAPADIRWLLKLTAPRVHAASAYMYRQLALDPKTFRRSTDVLARALEGGKHLTRHALKKILDDEKINAEGLRLAYLVMYAELEGIICSGPRQGKQFTYALLDERVPPARELDRDEALATFVERYFLSRGPATIQDFSYWSGLTAKDAQRGAGMLPRHFKKILIKEQEYILSSRLIDKASKYTTVNKKITFLMPDYDEYGMSYKDRSVLKTSTKITPAFDRPKEYSHWLVIDGQIAGNWTRDATKKKVKVEVKPFVKMTKAKTNAVKRAVSKYLSFAND